MTFSYITYKQDHRLLLTSYIEYDILLLKKKKVTSYVNQTLMFFGHVISMFILDLICP